MATQRPDADGAQRLERDLAVQGEAPDEAPEHDRTPDARQGQDKQQATREDHARRRAVQTDDPAKD